MRRGLKLKPNKVILSVYFKHRIVLIKNERSINYLKKLASKC